MVFATNKHLKLRPCEAHFKCIVSQKAGTRLKDVDRNGDMIKKFEKNLTFEFVEILKKIIRFPFIVLIRLYQLVISPLKPATCRYTPTCSQYSLEAIREWGIFKGGWLAIKRISSCHPWGGSGYDPVPTKDEEKKASKNNS